MKNIIANQIDIKDYKPKITHADFQWQIVKYAKLCGWDYQYWWRTLKSPKGFLDLVLVRQPRLIFAEIKIPPDVLSKEQQKWFNIWKQMPQVEVYIWKPDDWNDIEQILT